VNQLNPSIVLEVVTFRLPERWPDVPELTAELLKDLHGSFVRYNSKTKELILRYHRASFEVVS
jgi:hypothetical protein